MDTHTTADRPGRFWRGASALVVSLVLTRGIVYLCVMPPFEGWDEYQHVAYIQHLVETGRPAVLGETSVPRALLEAAVELPHPEGAAAGQLKATGALGHAAFWQRREAGKPSPTSRPDAPAVGLYEAQHASFYYRLAAPLFSAFGGANDLRASVGALRLANVALVAAAVGVVLAALRRVMTHERDALWIGAAVAAQPLFLINGVRVANDALGVLLAAVAVSAGLRWLAEEPREELAGRRAFVLGLAAGLAALAKATNLALLPFLAFVWLALAAGRRLSPRSLAVSGVLLAAGFLAATLGEFRFNLEHYGRLTPMQELVVNGRNGRTWGDLARATAALNWPGLVRRLWLRDSFFAGGWSTLRTHPQITILYGRAVTLGLVGWAWAAGLNAWRPRRGFEPNTPTFATRLVPLGCLVVAGSYTLALGYHRVQSTLAWGEASTGPWYASPALPWFLTLASAGGLCWFGSPRLARFRGALPAVIAAAGLAADPVAIWGMMLPAYSGGSSGWEALQRIAWCQPAALGTTTLLLAWLAEAALLVSLARWCRPPAVEVSDEAAVPRIAGHPLGPGRAAGYGA
ncbi:MAG: hypothetical protein U0835_23875 [Isosphaeraceae bacterium]